MNDELEQELLELFRQTAYMPYHEALSLLMACLPERAKLIKRMLVDDIRQFKLKIYFWETYSYDGTIPLLEPVHVTPDTLGYHVPPPSENYTRFWLFGELSTTELKGWLQNKDIVNSSLEIPANHIADRPNDELPALVATVNETSTPQKEVVSTITKCNAGKYAVCVPRSLWEGKPPSSVRNAMRPKEDANGFVDAVIAYVLFNWCKLQNKTEIGRLLGKPDQNDSSYRRLTTRLLEEAASFTITHD